MGKAAGKYIYLSAFKVNFLPAALGRVWISTAARANEKVAAPCFGRDHI